MKKMIFLIALLGVLCAGSAFAVETFTNAGPESTDLVGVLAAYKTSTNVSLLTTSAPAEYAAVSSHLNGARVFGSSSSESVIYQLEGGKTVGVSYSTAPDADFDFASDAAWKSL